jgi:hypothetical protein
MRGIIRPLRPRSDLGRAILQLEALVGWIRWRRFLAVLRIR